jgi:hypothetical protein
MKRLSIAALIALIALAVAPVAYADPVTLVDRGLPGANLNNAAGADRSNGMWLTGMYTATDYWLIGDTFTNTSSSTWNITTITLWTIGSFSTASVWGGTDTEIGLASTGYTATAAHYPGGEDYQGGFGEYYSLTRLDFAVDITLGAGQTYNFFLNGTGNGTYGIPFVSASNAGLSGTPQEGADNSYLYGHIVNGIWVPGDQFSWDSNGHGWDKSSDVNVIVTGTVPDGGTSATLLGGALLGLGLLRWKFRG